MDQTLANSSLMAPRSPRLVDRWWRPLMVLSLFWLAASQIILAISLHKNEILKVSGGALVDLLTVILMFAAVQVVSGALASLSLASSLAKGERSQSDVVMLVVSRFMVGIAPTAAAFVMEVGHFIRFNPGHRAMDLIELAAASNGRFYLEYGVASLVLLGIPFLQAFRKPKAASAR